MLLLNLLNHFTHIIFTYSFRFVQEIPRSVEICEKKIRKLLKHLLFVIFAACFVFLSMYVHILSFVGASKTLCVRR
jgi:hypothetical protein